MCAICALIWCVRPVIRSMSTSDKKVNTIDLGIVANSTVNKILDEFKARCDTISINFNQVKKPDPLFKKDRAKEADEEDKNGCDE